MLNRLSHIAAIIAGTLFLCASPCVHANDYQEAGTLFKQEQYPQALEKINNHLAKEPKDAKARFLKGLIITRQGNTPEAIKIFQALTVDYPGLPEPYNNLAVLFASQGQYDKARDALESAIRTHPSYATAHENLGDIYAKMASQAYDRALQLDRSNTATQTKLAMIQDLFASETPGKATPPQITVVRDDNKSAAATPVATKAAPRKESAEPAINKHNEILATVKAWAAAWSSQNVDSYLSFYADDFKTPGGESRAAWEDTRKQRVTAPKSIHVEISNVSVKLDGNDNASVQFRQSYKASHFKSFGNKTLLMVRSGDKWLIHEERTK